jgi:microcystin degradation protein MlrC
MTMRFFVAGMEHETNSFSPLPTGWSAYSTYAPPTGGARPRWQDLPPGYRELAKAVEDQGDEVVHGSFARAVPSGLTSAPAFAELKSDLMASLSAAGKPDAVLLWLHGSQAAVGQEDCEGEILEAVRAIVGADVPVGVVFDLHGTVTQKMLSNADVLISCKEYPHTDYAERAVEAARFLAQTARGEIKPVMAFQRVPMLGNYHTTRPPMRAFVDEVVAREVAPILSISLVHGFVWLDVTDMGAGVLVICDGDRAAAQDAAVTIATDFLARGAQLDARYSSLDQTIERVRASSGTVLIADLADNPGGGMAGDSTFILRRFIAERPGPSVFATIWDPVATENAIAAGLGARFPIRLGGKLGPFSGDPLDMEVSVTAIADCDAAQHTPFSDMPAPLGPMAALRVGEIDIIVNAVRTQIYSPDVLAAVGLEPAAYRAIVVKSAQHFHARFVPVASEVVYCETPGGMSSDYASLPYRRLRRPAWPLDVGAPRLTDEVMTGGRK